MLESILLVIAATFVVLVAVVITSIAHRRAYIYYLMLTKFYDAKTIDRIYEEVEMERRDHHEPKGD